MPKQIYYDNLALATRVLKSLRWWQLLFRTETAIAVVNWNVEANSIVSQAIEHCAFEPNQNKMDWIKLSLESDKLIPKKAHWYQKYRVRRDHTKACEGCQRQEFHLLCPAHGTDYYMSGVPYDEIVEAYVH